MLAMGRTPRQAVRSGRQCRSSLRKTKDTDIVAARREREGNISIGQQLKLENGPPWRDICAQKSRNAFCTPEGPAWL